MKRARRTRERAAVRRTEPVKGTSAPDDSVSILHFRIWLKDVSPMVWRRVLVSSTMTLHEFHGVLQVAMGWESIHLYQFIIHTVRYGSWETGARSPAIELVDLKLRKGSRFLYEYDLNIPWEHEVRLEEWQPAREGTATVRRRIAAGQKAGCGGRTTLSATR